jgi:hypothetical protein
LAGSPNLGKLLIQGKPRPRVVEDGLATVVQRLMTANLIACSPSDLENDFGGARVGAFPTALRKSFFVIGA